MRKLLTILIIILYNNLSFAQQSGIKISSEKRNEQIFIKDKHRIRLKTRKGVSISGKYKIIDSDHIKIKGITIDVKDIRKIKKNPLGVSILTSSMCFIGSAAILTGNYFSGIFSRKKKRVANVVPAAILAYIGVKSPNFSKGYRKSTWKIEIVE